MRPAHSASLEPDYLDRQRARVVERSVAVKGGKVDNTWSGAHIAREGRTVVVTVEAGDLVALHVGVNSWIRLVETAECVTLVESALSESA